MKLNSTARWFLVLAAISMATTIALGAAGMHGLKEQLASNDPGGWFQSALQYHQLNSLGLLIVGLVMSSHPSRWFTVSGSLLLAGIVLFSGNLYLRSLAGIHVFHAVTPLGGMAYIAGWLAFAIGAWRSRA